MAGPNFLSQKRASQGTKPIYGLTPCRNWILDKLERAILNAPENQEHLAAVRTGARDELAEERGFHERFRLGLRSRRNACVAVRSSTNSAWPAYYFCRGASKPGQIL
ncbi:MAG: hypothetical protein WCK27_16975 [Verrucomicrobiota bacterium]